MPFWWENSNIVKSGLKNLFYKKIYLYSRRDSASGQSNSHQKPSSSEKKTVDKNTKTLRENCAKGFKTALTLRMSKDNGKTKIEDEKLDELVKSIENELHLQFNRDTGPKYKAKYRSLISNIKGKFFSKVGIFL